MDSQIYADRLKSIFPRSKVLIIIREQSSFLYSFYKHDVSYNGGFWNIDEFLKPKWHFMRRSLSSKVSYILDLLSIIKNCLENKGSSITI